MDKDTKKAGVRRPAAFVASSEAPRLLVPGIAFEDLVKASMAYAPPVKQ